MKINTSNQSNSFLSGGGEMGELIRQKDWSKTTLGIPETWSQSLRLALSIILNTKFPMFLFWGDELLCFYNDAYRPSLGIDGKHPAMLGGRGEDHWQEIWIDIKPLIDNALSGGEANWSEDQLLPIYRNGKMENAYWTFSYSPINNEYGKSEGVFVTCVETTKKMEAIKELKISQEKLEFAINATELGTWDLDIKTNIFQYNQQIKHWYGLDAENEIEVSVALKSVVEEDLPRVINKMAMLTESKSDEMLEVQYRAFSKFDQKERTLLAKGKVLFDENGEALRLSGTIQDITEEVAYKKNQEEKYNFNTMLLESNPDCVKIINNEGKINYMNENGVLLLEGENKDYFQNRLWETMWGDQERILVHEAVEKAFQGQNINFQAPAMTVKGTYKWWDIIITALPNVDGNIKEVLAVSRDISQIKIDEKKLEESEELLRFALEGGNLGFFDTYPQKKELNWSAKTKELYGLAPDSYVTWENYESLIHPDDFENSRKVMSESLKNVNSGLYENEYRTASENYRWLRVSGKIKFDENNRANRITGIVQDITNKKLVELEINESEKNFRMLADQAPMWIWLIGEVGNLQYANPAFLNFVGVDQYSKFTENIWETVVHPDDVSVVYENYGEGTISQKPFRFECRIKNAVTDIYEWFFLNVVPRKEADKFVGFIGTATNIHQQKTQLFALKESEERFRTLAETLPVLVWITDENGNAEYASGKWEDYTGIKPNGANEWESIVHPEDLEGINQTWSNCLATGELYEYNVRLRSKTGEYRWFMVNGEPTFEPQTNRIIKWVGSFTDVNSEKSFSKELEKQVDERTRELLVAKDNLTNKNEELQKMNKELESFAYVSSHDLQEPLRKIQTFSNRILEKENENLSDSGKEYLRRMGIAGERMQQLIQDLLAYSRTKTSERKFESFDLITIINDVKDDLKDEIKQKNVIIETDDTCSIKVKIIVFQFRQLIYNLISNSIKFSKTDVQPLIKLICEVEEGSKMNHSNLKPTQKYYHIKISDNGIGFKADYKEKIFEIFQRLHGREEYTGTGIGLAIVKKITENHNGFITANGQPNEGATFDIYIPTNL